MSSPSKATMPLFMQSQSLLKQAALISLPVQKFSMVTGAWGLMMNGPGVWDTATIAGSLGAMVAIQGWHMKHGGNPESIQQTRTNLAAASSSAMLNLLAAANGTALSASHAMQLEKKRESNPGFDRDGIVTDASVAASFVFAALAAYSARQLRRVRLAKVLSHRLG